MESNKSLVADLQSKIYPIIRNDKTLYVMLDEDLASFYGTTLKNFGVQVKRNEDKLQGSYLELTQSEWNSIKEKRGQELKHGGRRYLPKVFLERGCYKLSMIFNNPKANIVADVILDAFFFVKDELSQKMLNYVSKDEFLKVTGVILEEMNSMKKQLPFKQEINNHFHSSQVNIIQGGENNSIQINSSEDIARLFLSYLLQKEVQQDEALSKLILGVIAALRNPEENKDTIISKIQKVVEFSANSSTVIESLSKLPALLPIIQTILSSSGAL